MRRLFLSMAVLTLSYTQGFAAGEPPPSPATTAAEILDKQLQSPGLLGGSGPPPLVFIHPAQQDIPIEVFVYDADGNLVNVETVPVPCPPSLSNCPFTHTGLTPEETREILELRVTETRPFNNATPISDWNAFQTVP